MGLSNWVVCGIASLKDCINGTPPTYVESGARIVAESGKDQILTAHAASENNAGVDIHLVMNALNYLTPDVILDGVLQKKSNDTIFDLADYLRRSLRWSVPLTITMAEECDLLENYLRLLTNPRGWTLRVSVGLPNRLKDHKITAHSMCRIANALMQGFHADVDELWTMTTYISAPVRKQLQIEMILQSNFNAVNYRIEEIECGLKRLCSAMSDEKSIWSYEASSIHGAYAATRVCIANRAH